MRIFIHMGGHAERRMQQRGIERADIEHALANCHLHRPGHEDGVCHEGPGRNNRTLKVWSLPYDDHNGDLIVKSAAWKDQL